MNNLYKLLILQKKSCFSFSTNYYKLFSLSSSFTEQELKQSYLELVKQYHPDLTKHQNANHIFQQIQQGYEILSNPQKRRLYDSKITPLPSTPISDEMRQKYYYNYSRKDEINDEFNFSYTLFKNHYEKVVVPKKQYQKYESNSGGQYYAKKEQKGEPLLKQIAYLGSILFVVFAAYYYTSTK